MTNEEREKKTKIANMLIGTIKDLRTPMLMYQVEKDVAKEALESYIKMLEQQPTIPNGEWIFTTDGNTDHITCSVCGRDSISNFDYCPNCGCYNGR